MNIFAPQQWIILGASTVIGFVALYVWLDYDFWTSVAIEVVLVTVTIWAQKRRVAQAVQR